MVEALLFVTLLAATLILGVHIGLSYKPPE